MYRLTFILFFSLHISYSQESTIHDSISGIVKYEFIKPAWDGHVWKPKSYSSELQFNASVSLFFYNRFSMLDGEETRSEFNEYGFSYKAISADEEGFQIFRNFKTNKISFRIPKTNPLDPVSVDDDWVETEWEIIKTSKHILGYSCKKAIGEFRGRTYEVWFTEEIPVSYGPWKLFGLPGLILEAKDMNNQIKFIAKEVCYPCQTNESIKMKTETKHMNMKEYVDYNDHIMENAEKDFKSTLDSLKRANKIDSSIEINLDKPTTGKDIEEKRKFMAETIYEWETKQKSPPIKLKRIRD